MNENVSWQVYVVITKAYLTVFWPPMINKENDLKWWIQTYLTIKVNCSFPMEIDDMHKIWADPLWKII